MKTNVPVLKCAQFEPSIDFVSSILTVEDESDLVRLWEESTGPEALIVRRDALAAFRQYGIIDYKGTQGVKSLGDYELEPKRKKGRPVILLIDSKYDGTVTLKNGLERFWARSTARNRKGLLVVGVADKIFDELLARSEKSEVVVKASESKWSTRQAACGRGDQRPQSDFLDLLNENSLPSDKARQLKDLEGCYKGNSTEAMVARQLAVHAAHNDVPVLILGSTGSGKEILARKIHQYGNRSKSGSFVAVNCGAIPPELFESELFGYKKGAFSGADKDKKGRWELADKGTLFLDEIGDLDLRHQVKILRAIEGEKGSADRSSRNTSLIWPVGAEKPVSVDIRIIAATNLNLYSMVREGRFREDLFYRLRCIVIQTPKLGDTLKEVRDIADYQWRKITRDPEGSLSDEIIDELKKYKWPGNVRQLKMVLNQLYSIFGKDKLRGRHLSTIMALDGYHTASKPPEINEKTKNLQWFTHLRAIDEVLHASENSWHSFLATHSLDWQAASYLRNSLYYHLNELEMLLRQHVLFPNEEMFTEVSRLKAKLAHLYSLLPTDPESARTNPRDSAKIKSCWMEVTKDMKHIKVQLFNEQRRLLNNA